MCTCHYNITLVCQCTESSSQHAYDGTKLQNISQYLKKSLTLTLSVLDLTLILLTWTIWRAPTNASKWRTGYNHYPANLDSMASSYQC